MSTTAHPTAMYLPPSDATPIVNHLNGLAELAHACAKDHGFHDENAGRSTVENFAIWTTNIHGEVSELWEAARNNTLDQPCDKPALNLTCEEEELADIILRTLDLAKARNVNIGLAVIMKYNFNLTRPHKHGHKLA